MKQVPIPPFRRSRISLLAALSASFMMVGGCASLHSRFAKEVASAGLPQETGKELLVSAEDIDPLPKSVQRYLRFMGVVGKPRVWSFRLAYSGRFRTQPDQAWMDCEAWQYNNRLDLSRIFHMTLRMNGFIPVFGRDTYLRGRGRMLVKVLDLFTVVDGQGPEYDIGELVTYLNDAILIAPSMLLGPQTSWTGVDENSFDVALTNRERTVTARVYLDEQGAPRDFSTTDRFLFDSKDPKHPLIRARWTTPMEGWQEISGRHVPTRGKAVWQLPQGAFEYADFKLDPGSLAFNQQPGN